MYKIAVLGDRASVSGFACIGLDTYPVTDKIQAAKKLKELAQHDYAVILITESLASHLEKEIDKFKENIAPAIILIPGAAGNTGKGMSMVAKSVERAVGTQLIGE